MITLAFVSVSFSCVGVPLDSILSAMVNEQFLYYSFLAYVCYGYGIGFSVKFVRRFTNQTFFYICYCLEYLYSNFQFKSFLVFEMAK
jgi:hypothetical protein